MPTVPPQVPGNPLSPSQPGTCFFVSSSTSISMDGNNSPAAGESADEEPGVTPADVRFAAMNFLARREHTKRELKQKLKRRFPDVTFIDAEIQRLTDENLQSDERFAENFVSYRAGLGFGMQHIRQDMRQRGLSDIEILRAVDAAEINWAALAKKVYLKKFGGLPAADIKAKAKRVRYMQYRGFISDDYQHLP